MKAHQAALALHVLALVIPAVALNAPLSATDETALATKLSRYTAMYKWMWELPWTFTLSTCSGILYSLETKARRGDGEYERLYQGA